MAIAHEPGELTDRIATRTASWLEEGWVEEVQGLLSAGYGGARAMGSVGYAQVRAALEGRLAHADLPAAIVRATRVFARRQRTWLRNVDVAWLR
jgi:tRNA dimethylallyltransferase